jgi:hypothetical protein
MSDYEFESSLPPVEMASDTYSRTRSSRTRRSNSEKQTTNVDEDEVELISVKHARRCFSEVLLPLANTFHACGCTHAKELPLELLTYMVDPSLRFGIIPSFACPSEAVRLRAEEAKSKRAASLLTTQADEQYDYDMLSDIETELKYYKKFRETRQDVSNMLAALSGWNLGINSAHGDA